MDENAWSSSQQSACSSLRLGLASLVCWKQAKQSGTRVGPEFQPGHVLGRAAEFGKLLPWHRELLTDPLLSSLCRLCLSVLSWKQLAQKNTERYRECCYSALGILFWYVRLVEDVWKEDKCLQLTNTMLRS